MDSLLDKAGFIDVKKLIAQYSVEEHQAKADEYFATRSQNALLLRKPFQNVPEAVQIMQGLSVVLRELQLFRGVRIVDFGAGTAWLSKILAYLDCEVIAVDLSRIALELGRKVIEKDNFADELKISYVTYDGVRIPLPDAHVERICCFDAFHHVADQRATLREFFRIMKPGAIAAFHEPGPTHSHSADAQYEMANHGVIENDIRIEEIEAIAKDVGFSDLKVAWYPQTPLLLDIGNFNKLVAAGVGRDEEHAIIARAGQEMQNMRVFFLYKAGEGGPDSRVPEGLNASLRVKVQRREGPQWVVSASATNTGSTTWLPSGHGRGAVRLGVQVTEPGGTMIALDYARADVSQTPVAPGETRTVEFKVNPPALASYDLVFDLVAEHVAWFAQLGSKTVTIRGRDLPG